MQASDLRVALFSGNYNYVRDGANQALNLLMGHAIAQGAQVRIYSPTTDTPAFPPTGDLVSVPAFAMPGGRGEYKVAKGIKAVLPDLEAFNPNVVHVSAPEILCHRAVSWAREQGIATVASVHTRFETYPQYYGLGFLAPLLIKALTRFYNRTDMVMPTGRGMVELLQGWGVTKPMRIWSRGVYHDRFNPGMRSLEWRREHGIADDEVVIGFLGRLVLEKGLDVFAEVIKRLQARGVKHRVMVIGEGPAREWFAERVPNAVFTGFQSGADLSRAVASMDVFFNPSVTESFGNVTLEAMASGVAVVAAVATGPVGLVEENVSGILCDPKDMDAYADALARFATDHDFRQAAGQAGFELAKGYEWDKINQVVVDTYLEAAEKKSK
ncbi:glycosyltransferase family 1 protein [Sphingomonas sp. LB-2]|uniref:glycosyltransferase family 4 protein n=1 Tax=Sphingomonas caeni TaxID=2984949 RepID=UPI002232705C|nr:glycosyltransferase family 1 protein [Sphingomonas caeni]MCW3849564.1 glycosyltransferase family 1 protein [Sphingomonas caeni]